MNSCGRVQDQRERVSQGIRVRLLAASMPPRPPAIVPTMPIQKRSFSLASVLAHSGSGV